MHQLGANGLDILLKLEKGPDMKLPGSKVDMFFFKADKVFSIANISEKPFKKTLFRVVFAGPKQAL